MKFIVIILLMIATPCFSESYLCTSELETGFSYNEKSDSWEQSNFKGAQFLVKPLNKKDSIDDGGYGVYNAKKGAFLFRCQYWFEKVGVAHCGNKNDYHFKFQRSSDMGGKFVYTDMGVLFLSGFHSAAPRVGQGNCIKL